VWDYAMAGAMVGVALVALITWIDVQDVDRYRFHADTWWSWVATLGVCGALVGRRRWPLRTFVVSLALILPLELDRHRDSIAFFALVITLYSVAAYLPLRSALRAVAMMMALYLVLILSGSTVLTAAPLTGPIFLATGFALGRTVRRRRGRQEREVEAAVERGAKAVESADLDAANERLRMAQELHDVVAHSLSVIAVQAGIGVHLIDRQPAEAARALDAIRTTSRTAADELTRLVDILRDGESTPGSNAPALHDLNVLIEQTRTAGVPIRFTTDGDVDTVPSGVSLAAYRIVQEALTNVVRHAGRAQATVAVGVRHDHVELSIDDDGHGAASMVDVESRSGGNGLIGMSERAQMYGGEVQSGPRPGGGFRVRATLPYFASPLANQSSNAAAPVPTEVHDVERHRRPIPPWVFDLGLAVAMVAVTSIGIITADSATAAHQYTPTNLWAWLLRIGSCLALAVRRRYPSLSFAAVWVLITVLAVGGYSVGFLILVFWIGLYTVASYASTRVLVGAAAATYAAIAGIAWSKTNDITAAGAVWINILFTGAAIAGYVAQRDRTRRATELAERENRADSLSRHARLIVTTERLRIADELSTIIRRSIQTITNEAGLASQTVEIDPATARRTLETISTISREALNDLRRLLKRMRTESEPMFTPITPALEVIQLGEAR
jgi:signal transduction histidine kinase